MTTGSPSRLSEWFVGGGIALVLLFAAGVLYGIPGLATAGLWALGVPLVLAGAVFLLWCLVGLVVNIATGIAAVALWLAGKLKLRAL